MPQRVRFSPPLPPPSCCGPRKGLGGGEAVSPGMEAAGTVVAVGKSIAGPQVGERGGDMVKTGPQDGRTMTTVAAQAWD